MRLQTFSTFYNKTPQYNVTPVQEKSSKRQLPTKKVMLFSTLISTGAGIILPCVGQNKKKNMKYVCFAKKEFNKLKTPEMDKKYHNRWLSRFSYNPVSQIKKIPQAIKNIQEDLAMDNINGKARLSLEIDEVEVKRIKNEHDFTLLNIKKAFWERYLTETIKKVTKSALIWSTITPAIAWTVCKVYNHYQEKIMIDSFSN